MSDIVTTDLVVVGGRTLLLDPSRLFASVASMRSKVARQKLRDAFSTTNPSSEQLDIRKNHPNWVINTDNRWEFSNWRLEMSIAGAYQLQYFFILIQLVVSF